MPDVSQLEKLFIDGIRDIAPPCPICTVPMEYGGLIAIDNGRGDQEMWRFDCNNGHTILVDFTSEMGD